MAIPTYNFIWQQGEDGQINMVYSAGDPPTPVNLTGYSLRMDVTVPGGSTPLYTFNTNDSVGGTVDEATLDAAGNINIVVPRSVSLPAGELAGYIGQPLNYDIFLRDATGKQTKILKGTLKYEVSVTLWT